MPEIEDAPPPAIERQSNANQMAKWMSGLHDALPNPSVAGSNAPIEPPAPPAEPPEAPTEPATPPAAAPAVPPATPATPPAPPAEQAEDRWPKSAKEWKNFTAAKKVKEQEYEKTLSEKEARIKELEAKTSAAGELPPEVQKQVETLKKENDDYSKQLRLLAVTTHPKFKSYFDGKTNAALAPLKSCVPADKLEATIKLIQAPDSETKDQAVEALMEEMTTLQRGRFLGVLNNLSLVDAERTGEIQRAQQDYEQIVAQNKAQQEGKRNNFTKLLDDTLKTMQDAAKGRPEYQLREGQTEWNASVQKRIENGRKLITGTLPPEVMFKAAFDAAAYPDVLAGYKVALAEVDKLKKQLAAMTAATPRVESAKRTEPNGNQNTVPALKRDARPMEYTQQFIRKFGDALRGEGV